MESNECVRERDIYSVLRKLSKCAGNMYEFKPTRRKIFVASQKI